MRPRESRGQPFVVRTICPERQAVVNMDEPIPEKLRNWEDRYLDWLVNKWAPKLLKLKTRGTIVAFFWSLFLICVISTVVLKSAGYTPKMIAPRGSIEYLGLEHLFEFFGLFPAWMAFVDVDVPNKQAEMLTLFDAMTGTDYTQKHPIPPYLSMFALLVSFGAPQFLDNTTFTHPLFAPSSRNTGRTPTRT